MYTLFLGSDPEICSGDFERVKILARETHSFNTRLEAEDYSKNNDDDFLGYSFYSCWFDGNIVFIS